eukprot:6240215-Alexandrium_andersonii.AAC.1
MEADWRPVWCPTSSSADPESWGMAMRSWEPTRSTMAADWVPSSFDFAGAVLRTRGNAGFD